MTTSISEDPRDDIRAAALEAGFDVCGFAVIPDAWPAAGRLREFLDAGRHGTMAWMETTADRRAHPMGLWPQARSAIVLGQNYGPDHDPRDDLAARSSGVISVYARGRDYHDLIKGRLKGLAAQVARRLGTEVKVFVDTAPLMEKPLAALAGLGWQGKHTNLVSETFGSWLFLGAILVSATLPADAPAADRCGSCRACLDACPTGAFVAPYQLDARACLSYLTIEHGGPIPETYRAALGNRIYGCDDCLAVCPWNKFASMARESALHAREALKGPGLAPLSELDDPAFRTLFSGSPVKRSGRDRFVRNVVYAIGNSADAGLRDSAAARLEDDNETVREAARWALARLERAGYGAPTESSSILKTSTEDGGMGPTPSSP